MEHWRTRLSLISKHRTIWLGIGLGAVFWVVETFMDTHLFHQGTLSERFVHPDPNELWMRSIIVAAFVAFGVYSEVMINKLRRAEESLTVAHEELKAWSRTRTEGLTMVNELLQRELDEGKQAQKRLARMNESFLSFGVDPIENIDRLTHLCGELLGARAAFYNRLDEGKLFTMGHWPECSDLRTGCDPEGRLCYEAIRSKGETAHVVRNLGETPYARTDPKIKLHGYQTYVGQAVKLGESSVGSLCVFYGDDVEPREEDLRLMGIIASAVGVEEIRKRSEEALRESERQLHHLSAQLLATQENERKRIATQLHDSIGQSLSAIKFSIEEALEKLGENGVRHDFKSLRAAVPLIQAVVDEVRRIQKNLRPSMLDDLGIVATLGWFCRDFETIYSGIQVERIVAVREGEVPEPLKIVLFRIVQEAMNNVAKHSRADRVELNLKTVEDGLELRISDNGVGLDVHRTISGSHPGGLGVSSMRERTELSGGTFALEALERRGTTVVAFWPWRVMESSPDTGHPA